MFILPKTTVRIIFASSTKGLRSKDATMVVSSSSNGLNTM